LVQLSSDGRNDAVAESVAVAAATDIASTAAVLASAAALSQGTVNAFGTSQAKAFGRAKRKGSLNAFTRAVSQAIGQGGDSAKQAYGVAFAEAAASGGEDQEALAQATAAAFCEGGGTATAFASAYSVALSRNKQGCLVLTQARALAVAQCGGGQFTAYAEASAESQVLGLCGLLSGAGNSVNGGFPGININDGG
jgi:hypothetical protein